jgi:hypothetical protein
MENTDRFEALLRRYSYQELSPEDRAWVTAFVATEQEYESMRRVTLQLEERLAPADLTADPSMLKSLQRSFDEKYTSGLSFWSPERYAAIAAALVVGALGWWAGSSWGGKTIYIDRTITRIDTVHVKASPDTIILERVVYRSVSLPPPTVVVQHNDANPLPAVNRGVNMKEKEELEKLLVSGGF